MHRSSKRSMIQTDGKVRAEAFGSYSKGYFYPSWEAHHQMMRHRQERRRVKDMIRRGQYD